MFQRRVAPVLAARGVVTRGSSFDQIILYLREQLRAWAVTVRRPNVGAIGKVDFSRRPPRFLDCRIRVPDLPDGFRKEAAVRIRGVFGTMTLGELCNAGMSQTTDVESLCESGTLLALTCREITLLADVLPGKDCWIAVEVWPNELLPMKWVIQRPQKPWFLNADRIDVVPLEHDRVGFGIKCPKCDGSGSVECGKCGGTGVHKPRTDCNRCGGRGNFSVVCRKCGGSGSFEAECRRCGGSGSHKGGICYGCNGSGRKEFDCHPCHGTGRRTLECKACEGRGYFPQLDCSLCEGSGALECSRCGGTGVLHARFSTCDGTYSIACRGKDGTKAIRALTPRQITLFDWGTSSNVDICTGAAQMLHEVLEATGPTRACDPEKIARIADHCRQLRAVERCLTQSLEARDLRETRTVCVGRPGASVSRSQGGVVYEFPVISGSSKKWVREGLLPFPRKTPVQLEHQQPNGSLSPIDLPVQCGPTIGNQAAPVLVGCSGQGKHYRLAIRFPLEFDPSSLPPESYLTPAVLPPPEIAQLRHLHRWCSQDNWGHPVLHAIVCPSHDENSDLQVRLFSSSIARYPRQVEAVRLGVSKVPLGLIKGPPGTGKTTVITEIVRQLIDRGQRVLICSQTHQAVQNVLERLHREGGIRMIRHGHEADLTDLERRYRAGGVEDEYCTSVRTRSHEVLLAYQKRLEFLDQATEALPRARNAAARLADARRQAAAELERLAQQRSYELGEADRILAQQREEANAKAQMALQSTQARDRAAKRDLKRVQNAIGKTERRRDAAERAHVRKTGKKPEVVEVRTTWRLALRDALLPNWAVGATALQDRYSRCCHELHKLRLDERKLLDAIETIAAETKAIHLNLEREVAKFTAEHEAKIAVSESRYNEQTSATRQQLAAEERQLREIQAAAMPFAVGVGISLTDDAPPEAWQTAVDRAQNDRHSVSERVEFLSRWLRDIEAEPAALVTFCWDHIQVFFSTCVGLASWRSFVERGRNAVDLVIIDEAAHATAPETLIPMLYSQRVLLIGDEMQLPPLAPPELDKCRTQCPVVAPTGSAPQHDTQQGGIAAEVEMSPCWLERSLFEWLWRNCCDIPRVMLDTQFRMHPAIADFVGSVFYPEGLHTAVDENERTIAFGEFNRPVCLIPTSAYKDRFEEYLAPGYRNYLEARIVRRVLEKAELELAESQSFGVITPYAHQVDLILRELDTMLPSLQKVRLAADDVASVDSFQGSERDVIVISFVRSPASCTRCEGTGVRQRGQRCDYCDGKGWRGTGLTFARDLRRLNVAFSRARKMLILVGDIDALTDSRYRGGAPGGRVLAMFRDYVRDRGKVLHVWERGHDNS